MRYNHLILISIAAIFFSSCNGHPGVIVPNFEEFDSLNPSGIGITVSHDINSGSLPVFTALTDEFNKTNEYGIAVNLGTPNSNPIETSDMAIVNPSNAAALLRNGLSIELSSLISHPVWGIEDGRSGFFKAAYRQTDYWDFSRRITSLPLLMNAGIMIVNNSILSDAGYKNFPKSWVGMTGLIRKSGYELQRPVGMALDTDSLVAVIQARGGSILLPIGFNYSINNPVVNRGLRYIRRYEKKNLLSINRTNYINQTEFVFGRLLAVYTGIDGIKAYDELISMVESDIDWGVELMPTRKPGDGVSVNCLYSAAVMDGDMDQQLASWIFIKWLAEPEQQKRLAFETGSLPTVSAALTDIIQTGKDDFPKQWIQAAELISDSNMELIPSLYDYNYVSEQFKLMVDRIFEGRWVWLETLRLDKKIKTERRRKSEKEAGKV